MSLEMATSFRGLFCICCKGLTILAESRRTGKEEAEAKRDLKMSEAEAKCVFCQIITGQKPEVELLYQDDEFVGFRDIRPAAPHHYLIVPRKHIKNPTVLVAEDTDLVKKLVEIGKGLLEEQDASLEDTRFGFHWPPFVTIQHLHLHAISPTAQMSFLSRLIFRPNSYWFITADSFIDRLEKTNDNKL